MVQIEVRDNDIEDAIRKLRKKIVAEKVLKAVSFRERHPKPSARKKEKDRIALRRFRRNQSKARKREIRKNR